MIDEKETKQDEKGGAGNLLSDTMKKALATGLSVAFLTEEGIRNFLGDMRLPKETVSALIAQAEKARKDLGRVASDEVKSYLSKLDATQLLRKALVGLKIDVEAKIRISDDDSSSPEVVIKKKSSSNSVSSRWRGLV